MQCWLECENGLQIRVQDLLVIGREVDCDLVLANPRISKKHALIRTVGQTPELLCLGRNPTRVNGNRIDGAVRLRNGDVLEVVDTTFTVWVEDAPDQVPVAWMLELPTRALVGLLHSPFLVGGGHRDHLRLPDLPPGALCFLQAQEALVLEPGIDLKVAGEPVEASDLQNLGNSDVIEVQDQVYRVYAQRPGSEQTTLWSGDAPPLPVAMRLEFLRSGGRLSITFAEGTMQVHLSEQRSDFVALLLKPPGDYVPGDFIPDEVVLPKLWPGSPTKDRTDINVLLFRIRRDLLRVGINPFRVIERLKGGGATRMRIVPSAVVEIC